MRLRESRGYVISIDLKSELTLEEHYCCHWQSRQQAELLHNWECAELCLRKCSLLVSRCRVMCLASSSLDDVLVFQLILIILLLILTVLRFW